MLGAFYNEYNNVICVYENRDMRIYKSSKGQLSTLIKNLVREDDENVIIKCLRQDKRSRRGYLTTWSGTFKVIDIQTGV